MSGDAYGLLLVFAQPMDERQKIRVYRSNDIGRYIGMKKKRSGGFPYSMLSVCCVVMIITRETGTIGNS